MTIRGIGRQLANAGAASVVAQTPLRVADELEAWSRSWDSKSLRFDVSGAPEDNVCQASRMFITDGVSAIVENKLLLSKRSIFYL
jgi:hypothetical protein